MTYENLPAYLVLGLSLSAIFISILVGIVEILDELAFKKKMKKIEEWLRRSK